MRETQVSGSCTTHTKVCGKYGLDQLSHPQQARRQRLASRWRQPNSARTTCPLGIVICEQIAKNALVISYACLDRINWVLKSTRVITSTQYFFFLFLFFVKIRRLVSDSNPNPHPTHPHPRPITYRRSYRTENPNQRVHLDKTDPEPPAHCREPSQQTYRRTQIDWR